MFKPTPEQKEALASYREWAEQKRPAVEWKTQLLLDWHRAGSQWPGEWAYLQQIRNQAGPKWLAGLK